MVVVVVVGEGLKTVQQNVLRRVKNELNAGFTGMDTGNARDLSNTYTTCATHKARV